MEMLPGHTPHPSTKFHSNLSSSFFFVLLLTNKQTNVTEVRNMPWINTYILCMYCLHCICISMSASVVSRCPFLEPVCVCLFHIKQAQHVTMWLRMTNLLSLSTATQLSTAWPGPCFSASLTRTQAACLLNYPCSPNGVLIFKGNGCMA